MLGAIGPKVTYIGPNGHAILTKVAINLALVVSLTAFAEGVALVAQAGVSRAAVLPPSARHEVHAHPNCVVLSGSGESYTNDGREPSRAGDVIFTPRGNFHGFDNTSDDDVLLISGWSGAGSLEAAGYDLPEA